MKMFLNCYGNQRGLNTQSKNLQNERDLRVPSAHSAPEYQLHSSKWLSSLCTNHSSNSKLTTTFQGNQFQFGWFESTTFLASAYITLKLPHTT